MKTRNEIYGGTFSSPEAPDTNANGELKKLVLSDNADITKNRSSWIRTIFYNIMDSFIHKTEDRATGSNIGVSGTGIESTQTVYTTPEQLPEVAKTTNDFSTPAKSDSNGVLTTTNDLFSVSTVTSDRKNKRFVVNFSEAGVLFFKARTWLQSDLVTLITNTLTNPDGSGIFPVGSEIDRPSLEDPTGWLNMCLGTRTIARASAATATLKDDKYKNLFVFLYLNYSDTLCPVLGGRSGAANLTNANIDWEAGKNIALPDYRGRVSGYYKSADTNFGEIGKEIGTEILVASDLPVTSPYGITVTGSGIKSPASAAPTYQVTTGAGTGTMYNVADFVVNTASPTTNSGGGQKHFQPTKITCKLIKY